MNSRVPALEVGLQSATKNSEAPRQMQVFQWPGKVEGSRLALQEGQVVARVEGDLSLFQSRGWVATTSVPETMCTVSIPPRHVTS